MYKNTFLYSEQALLYSFAANSAFPSCLCSSAAVWNAEGGGGGGKGGKGGGGGGGGSEKGEERGDRQTSFFRGGNGSPATLSVAVCGRIFFVVAFFMII